MSESNLFCWIATFTGTIAICRWRQLRRKLPSPTDARNENNNNKWHSMSASSITISKPNAASSHFRAYALIHTYTRAMLHTTMRRMCNADQRYNAKIDITHSASGAHKMWTHERKKKCSVFQFQLRHTILLLQRRSTIALVCCKNIERIVIERAFLRTSKIDCLCDRV